MRRFLDTILRQWRHILLILLLLFGASLLVGYKLGSLPGNGLAPAEIKTYSEYVSLREIVTNPIHLPYKSLGWIVSKLPYMSNATVRLPAALLGLATLIPLAYVMRRWYGTRVAIMGMIIFATSAWFLHVSRAGVYDVEFMWATATLLGLHVLLHAHAENTVVTCLWLAGLLLLLFVPGFIWLVLLNIILQRDDILDAWDALEDVWKKILFIAVPVVVAAGIGYIIFRDVSLSRPWLGIPSHPELWVDMLKRLGNSIAYFLLRGPHDAVIWLGRLPVLNAFMSVMLIAGTIFYARHLKAFRIRLLVGFFVLGAILTALRLDIKFAMLVPIVYLIATAGIAYLLHEWLQVFPRNPLARGLGIGVVAVVITASCLYNLRSYVVAWPHNKATQTTFVRPLPPK